MLLSQAVISMLGLRNLTFFLRKQTKQALRSASRPPLDHPACCLAGLCPTAYTTDVTALM
uniref:Uncharacterized protein n=1 Tax=Aegilops tauschii subsp. strangulata TaxID=200361 RepID=A0A453GDR6_AEGTS